MKLAKYRQLRDPTRTNEPFGPDPEPRGPTLAGAFVIHQHDATRMHWDLRLEIGGTLASFAVPRGPSLDPAEKRLAVHTEDHPIEYLDFEAVIPDGQYGSGAMILWDKGRVRYANGNAEEGLAKGKLDFDLEGFKAKGRFSLVKIKSKESKESEWLLFKKKDAFSNPARDLVKDEPRSVLSGLTIDELAKISTIAVQIEQEAAKLGAPEGEVDGRAIVPMACALSGAPEVSPDFLYELKLDGVRAIATKIGARASLFGRRQKETSDVYPEVTRALKALPCERVVLDGEIVAFDAKGRPSFHRIASRIHLVHGRDVKRAMLEIPVVFVAFDLLAVGKRDLRGLPLFARKALLARLLPAAGVVRALDAFPGDARPLLAFSAERRLEGVVAKRAASTYQAGPKRSDDWIKMKTQRDEDFVVVGVVRGEGVRDKLGALDLATYANGELRYRGKVGSGLDDRTIDALVARLSPLAVDAPVARGEYGPAPKGRTHVKPEVVVRVRFLEWSEAHQLRQPVFEGVRDDVRPEDCTATPPDEALSALDELPSGEAGEEPSAPADARKEDVKASAPGAGARRVVVSNRAKVLFPDDGFTKDDLTGYYEAIAPWMLPYLKDRPIMMVRYPDGIRGKHFYQWNAPPGVPSWIRTFRMRGEDRGEAGKGTVDVFLLDEPDALVYVANLAAIPIHVLASRATTLTQADWLTLDFDVKGASLKEGIEIVRTLRDLLSEIRLDGFPKTSGQTGLHVFIPLGPGHSFDVARALAELLGRLLVAHHPKTATMERIVSKRGPKVYVDTGQTGPTRTIVAPWAVRATPGARVSTPLHWDEVSLSLDPAELNIKTVLARVKEHGDPMRNLLASRPDIPAAVERLSRLATK